MAAVLSKRDQRIMLVLLAALAALICFYYVYLFRPFFNRVTELERAIKTENLKLQHIDQLLTQEPQFQKEYEQLYGSIQLLRASMPSEQELASVIERLSGMATQAGVKIQTIFPQRSLESLKVVAGLDQKQADPRTKLYKEIPIQIDARAGFHQLGMFLNRVERGRQPMSLKTLRITSNPKEARRHAVEIVLIGYFSVNDGKDAHATTSGRSGS